MVIYKITHNEHLSIMMVDINGLKVINDTFGHHKGDKLFRAKSREKYLLDSF